MKLIHVPILGLILIMITCCNEIDHILDMTEIVINENPEEALRMVRSVPDRHVKKKQQARKALLHSIALDKNYIDLTSDSIIAPAVAYYSKRGLPREMMLVNYYYGRICFNRRAFPEAIVRFTEAEKYAGLINDKFYSGLIAMAKADTYNNQFNTEEEMLALYSAREYFKKCNAEKHSLITDFRLAVAYRNNQQNDKAEDLYRKVLDEAKESDNQMILNECLKNYAGFLTMKDSCEAQKAVEIYNSLLAKGYSEFEISEIGEMACAFALAGDFLTGGKMLEKVDSEHEAYYYKYIIERYKGNNQEAFRNLEKTIDSLNDRIAMTVQQSAVTAERDYFEKERLKSENRALIQRSILVCIFILVLLMVSLAVIIYGYYYEIDRIRNMEIIRIYENMNIILNENKELMKFRQRISIRFRDQFRFLRDVCDTYTFYDGRSDKTKRVYEKVDSLITGLLVSKPGVKSELERMIDLGLNNTMKILRDKMHGFKEDDFIIITYILAGFDATLISRLMQIDSTKAHRMKFRLVERIIKQSEIDDDMNLRHIAGYIKS